MSSEYWGGIDMYEPDHFAVDKQPPVHISQREYRGAAMVLASCLEEVIHGDYAEVNSGAKESFGPSSDRMGDGTVVIVDREHLFRWTYPTEHDREWQSSDPPSSAAIPASDLAGYWSDNQPLTFDSSHFGDERAVFLEEKMIYGRFLQWGVLISTKNNDRLLATWAFSAPCLAHGSVSLPRVDGVKLFRTGEKLPLSVQEAMPQSDLHLNKCAIRAVERIKAIKIVHAATVSYEPQADPKSLSEKLAEKFGRFAPPRRQLIPT